MGEVFNTATRGGTEYSAMALRSCLRSRGQTATPEELADPRRAFDKLQFEADMARVVVPRSAPMSVKPKPAEEEENDDNGHLSPMEKAMRDLPLNEEEYRVFKLQAAEAKERAARAEATTDDERLLCDLRTAHRQGNRVEFENLLGDLRSNALIASDYARAARFESASEYLNTGLVDDALKVALTGRVEGDE